MSRGWLRYIGVGLVVLLILLGLGNLVYSIQRGESYTGSILAMVVAILAVITLETALSPEIVHPALQDINLKLGNLSSDATVIRTNSTVLKDIDLKLDNLSNDVTGLRTDLTHLGTRTNASVTNTIPKGIVVGWVCVTAGAVGLVIALYRRSRKAN
jgi:hypothetical protein